MLQLYQWFIENNIFSNFKNAPLLCHLVLKNALKLFTLPYLSVEAAKNAYNSEDYQAALKKLDGGADRFLFVIEGA